MAIGISIGGLIASSTIAQEITHGLRPVRIVVRHGDPWVIVSLLKGQSPPFSELSTLAWFLGGLPLEFGPSAGGIGPEGTYIVNPADNCIYFLPRRS